MAWKLGHAWTAPLPEGTKARRWWSRANIHALGGIAVLACDEIVIEFRKAARRLATGA
ncbi:hypothetical protein [Azospirillum brasilense]|uniref:hypothetical protein n=1 Tax=Azospirillum brasilense TaxID=192 RepID=UPI00190B433B|nr:hypothetical protein [Azospirillum brasilense]